MKRAPKSWAPPSSGPKFVCSYDDDDDEDDDSDDDDNNNNNNNSNNNKCISNAGLLVKIYCLFKSLILGEKRIFHRLM
jgi:hypothetical protein